MQRKERFKAFIDYFSHHKPEVQTELNYENPYQLLIAVMLSAQCTDKRINQVTPALFRDFPSAAHLEAATFEELLPYIKSVSYPNNKTKHLLGMARILEDEFRGVIPDNIKDLQRLPGVGRKTANVIASVIYDQPTMAVDTHVFRVSKRLGLVNQNAKSPLEVEKQLVKCIPEQHIPKAHHWLILHGRYVCLARRPKCEQCQITFFCRYYQKNGIKIPGN